MNWTTAIADGLRIVTVRSAPLLRSAGSRTSEAVAATTDFPPRVPRSAVTCTV